MGIILISSELPEVIENSNRILVMYRGTIAAERNRNHDIANPPPDEERDTTW